MLQEQFRQITHLFFGGAYEEGLKQLTHLIEEYPNNGMLYANRALFLSQLTQDVQAIDDLEKAIEINPFNYLAYYNLFSIQSRNNQDQQSYRNLCCSISVMYLLRARKNKSFKDLDQSIKLAPNNIEARVLKGLLHGQAKYFQEARCEFMQALELDPSNQMIEKLLIWASQQIDPQSIYNEHSCNTHRQYSRRLKSELILPETDELIQKVNQKVIQFNQLYNDLNIEIGGLTQKIPKQSSLSNSIQTFMLQKSRSKSKQSATIALEDEEQFSDPNSVQNKCKVSDGRATAQNDGGYQSDVKHFNQIEVIAEQKQKTSQNSLAEQQMCALTNIYPLIGNPMLKISLINLVLYNLFKQPLNGVYCIITYNRQKLITSPQPCLLDTCTWNKTFDPVGVTSEAGMMKIKVYDKRRDAIRDYFVGQFEVVITTADLLRLPLMDRSGEKVGDILVDLKLMESIE